jgi:hypothetical protein
MSKITTDLKKIDRTSEDKADIEKQYLDVVA